MSSRFIVVGALLLTQVARAESGFELRTLLPVTPSLTSLEYDLSVVYQQQRFGYGEGPMTLTGVHFTERNSGLGKMAMFFVTQLAAGMTEAAAGSGLLQKHLGTDYYPGYRVDYYQRFSESEVAQMRAAREESGRKLLASNMSLDLQLYAPLPGRSTSSGWSAEITPLTVEFTDSGQLGLEVAFAYTKLGEPLVGESRWRTYESLGVPLRLMVNWQFVQLQLQYTMNVFGGFGFDTRVADAHYADSLTQTGKDLTYHTSPLSLSVSLQPLRWVFVRGTGSWNRFRFDTGALGFMLEAGVRL
jgi:hypothetical protein